MSTPEEKSWESKNTQHYVPCNVFRVNAKKTKQKMLYLRKNRNLELKKTLNENAGIHAKPKPLSLAKKYFQRTLKIIKM